MQFLENNELLFETSNFELAKEAFNLNHPDLSVNVYNTRTLGIEPIAKFIIEFASDAGLIFFGHWLATRNSKESSNKTTINKNEIPQTVEEITLLIKEELAKVQDQKTSDNK